MRVLRLVLILTIASIALPPLAAAQPAQRGKLIITVADQTGAVIPNVAVTLDALEAAAKAAPIPSVKTTDKGVVTFDDLVVGRYSARAEFPGFKMGLLRDFRVNRGDNKHVVVLVIEGLAARHHHHQSVVPGPGSWRTHVAGQHLRAGQLPAQ